jgi:peptide/nickel transport system substrate-binding protein
MLRANRRRSFGRLANATTKRLGVEVKRFDLAALLVLAIVVTAACTTPSTTPSASGSASPTAGQPQRGGELVMAIRADVTTLDPRLAGTNNNNRLATHIWSNTLVQLNEKLEYVPELAESWDRSADGKVWTFKLRKGVKFHDGSAFGAKDVKFTIESVMDPALKSPFRSNWVFGTTLTKVDVVDDSTVRMTFPEEPSNTLLQVAYQRILPKDYTERVGVDGFNQKPVGTGPFKFVSYTKADKIVFDRNPDYFKPGLPYLDKLTVRIIIDPATRLAALQAKEIGLSILNADDLKITERDSSLKNYKYLYSGYYYMAYNERDPLLKNKLVRQAINYAIDSQEIINAVVVGSPAHNMVPPAMSAYDPSAPKYTLDVNKTKQLLTQAGYPNGIDFTILGLAGLQPYQQIAEVVQNQLNRTGVIRAKLQLVDFTTAFVPRVFTDYNYQAGITALTAVSPTDAFDNFAGGTTPDTENFMQYLNPEVQRLIDDAKANRQTNPTKAQEDYKQLQRLIWEDAPMSWLGYWGTSWTARADLQGFIGHPNQSFEYLEGVWLKK